MAEGEGFPGMPPEADLRYAPRHALKSAISFRDMIDGRSFKFEIDPDYAYDANDDLSGSDDEDFRPSYRRDVKFFNDPDYQIQPDDGSFRLDEPIDNFDELEAKMESIHESGKIKKLIVKEGNSIQVPSDAKVFIQYAGFAEGQDEPFDKRIGTTRKSAAAIFLGSEEVVYGLEKGLSTMHLGEIARFLIHPEFAFGELGCAPRIPSNARIVFTVEMLRFIPAERFNDVKFMSVDARAQLPFSQILQAAKSCRKSGGESYYNNDYKGALRMYTRGIQLLEEYPTANDADNKARDDEISVLCSNKAQCLLKMQSAERACVACKLGLRCANEYTRPKLLIRFAEAKYMLAAYDDALKYCLEAIKLFKAQDIREKKHTELLQKIRTSIKDQKGRDAFLAKKMLNLSTVGSKGKVGGRQQ